MKTDAMIKNDGFQALSEKLDVVELERFFVIVNREKSNYTEWRKDLFENLTLKELADKANEYSKSIEN